MIVQPLLKVGAGAASYGVASVATAKRYCRGCNVGTAPEATCRPRRSRRARVLMDPRFPTPPWRSHSNKPPKRKAFRCYRSR